MLGDAQKAAARSDDAAIRETLVDIVARRSMETARTRLALTLNDAAIRAANLTADEYAALSLVYVSRYTVQNGIDSFDKLCDYVNSCMIPFAKLVSREAASFWQIQAQSCGSIETGRFFLERAFQELYAGVLGTGFSREQLEAHLPDGKKNTLDQFVVPCVHDETKLQPNAIRFEIFKGVVDQTSLTDNELQNVWSLFVSTIGDIQARLRPKVPEVDLLFDVWNSTPLKQLNLTSTGIAIGHANAARVVGFKADLKFWIK
jgi:hypothetical protein